MLPVDRHRSSRHRTIRDRRRRMRSAAPASLTAGRRRQGPVPFRFEPLGPDRRARGRPLEPWQTWVPPEARAARRRERAGLGQRLLPLSQIRMRASHGARATPRRSLWRWPAGLDQQSMRRAGALHRQRRSGQRKARCRSVGGSAAHAETIPRCVAPPSRRFDQHGIVCRRWASRSTLRDRDEGRGCCDRAARPPPCRFSRACGN